MTAPGQNTLYVEASIHPPSTGNPWQRCVEPQPSVTVSLRGIAEPVSQDAPSKTNAWNGRWRTTSVESGQVRANVNANTSSTSGVLRFVNGEAHDAPWTDQG